MQATLQHYLDPLDRKMAQAAAAVEAEGYCRWPRVREMAEFCKRMGYTKIGMAFCVGLVREASIAADILKAHGLTVISAICKTGGFPKSTIEIPPEDTISHGAKFEAMCNPIAQAELMNRENTDFNIIVGLCIGHDALFTKYSKALVSTLIAKDRALANNPAGALYCSEGYLRTRLIPEE